MTHPIYFVLKVFLISLGLAAVIRYGAPYLAIPATPITVLTAVFLPTLLTAIGLGWRSRQSGVESRQRAAGKR
jgi:membrane protein implicated in regulation of membrane protease activity